MRTLSLWSVSVWRPRRLQLNSLKSCHLRTHGCVFSLVSADKSYPLRVLAQQSKLKEKELRELPEQATLHVLPAEHCVGTRIAVSCL